MTTLTTACLTARRLDSRSLILKQEDKKKINEVDDHRGYTLGSKIFCRNAYNMEERDIAVHITCKNAIGRRITNAWPKNQTQDKECTVILKRLSCSKSIFPSLLYGKHIKKRITNIGLTNLGYTLQNFAC